MRVNRKLVLGSRGPKSLAVRTIANTLALAMLWTPLRMAYALPAGKPGPAASAGAQQPNLPADAPGTLGTRLRPSALTVIDGVGVDSGDLWALFDGAAHKGLDTDGRAVRFRVDLAQPAYLDAIGVFGAAEGLLGATVTIDSAAVDLFKGANLAAGMPRWNRHPITDGTLARSLTLIWQPARAGAVLRELELWGRVPSSHATAPPAVLPDALYTGVPAGAHEIRAPQAEQTVALSTVASGAAGGRFTVDLGRDPGAFERLFLVYELQGLPHFTAAVRAINGQRPEGKFGVSFGAKGGLQVEEIPVGAMQPGLNAIQFLPADDHNPTSYRVGHLRVVGVPARADGVSDDGGRQWAALRDGREATGWKAEPRAKVDGRFWTFAGITQPRMLDLRLPGRGSGILTVAAADAGTSGKVTVQLDGLAAGWHRVPLETLPATDHLILSLAAGKEAPVALSELAVSGSPVPADEAPRLRITYPLSGECVNQKVHVRGFVSPAEGAMIAVNGVPVDSAVSAQGAFALQVAEKAAGGGAGKPFHLTVESSYPNGARVRRAVSVGGCVERPPVVLAANGRPRQPVEDLGAPYGATITPGSAADLSFAGARLEIPAGAVDKNVRLTVRPLPTAEVAPMDAGMTNITPGGQAFRFGPVGMVFKKPIRVTLPYDNALVPRGYTEGEARTFYYDEGLKRWEQVGLIGQESGRLVAVSEHFTDFINATIAVPDHSGTQSLNPTSMKNMKLADPAAGISLIEPPAANSSGAANLRFPIEVLPGRGGVQPALAISYNSESRNSWLGVGWDLGLSVIQIDTRFGVPKYDGTETYLLDGQQLTPIATPAGAPGGGQYFGRRVEGPFDWIQRLGTGPTNFTWVVTDKSGIKSFYGETAAARLADPIANPGNIFRWALARVRDPFGNEMKVTYQPDTGSNDAEPFTQIYPSVIDYTSNATTGLAAAYHVDLARGGRTFGSPCSRPDAVIDGRPGFQEFTRCLLNRVSVRLGAQVIRQYDLTYQAATPANFQKALLSSITMRGLNGTNALYKHDFNYFAAPVQQQANALDSLSLFQSPVTWTTMPKADGTPRAADGIAHIHESSSTHSTHGGIGIAGFEAFDIGGSDTSSGESTSWRVLDLNGDGLPDGVSADGLLDLGVLVGGKNRSSVDLFTGHFTPLQTTNFVGTGGGGFLGGLLAAPLASVNRNVINLHGGFAGVGTLSGNFDWTNTSRDMRALIDIDGDGYLDQLIPTSAGLSVRRNDRNNGFKPIEPWNNYAISNTSCSLDNLLGNVTRIFADGITRLIAPATGVLGVAGDITKAVAGTGGKVAVKIFRSVTSIFSFRALSASAAPTPDLIEVFSVVIDKNSPPCIPGPGNSCAGGLTIPVQAGDRVYMQVSPLEAPGEAIAWDPQFTYTSVNSVPVTATQQNLREPDGSFIYKFSQSGDFKQVGRTMVTWSADSNGTVAIEGQAVKSTTSDDVRIQVVRQAPDGTSTVLLTQQVPANSVATVPMALGAVAVQARDKLFFQVLSDLPIDPDRVQWQPIVTYQNYCRFDPNTGTSVCGNVQCTSTDPITCTMAGDPIPSFPVPTEILKQQVPVLFPLFRFQPGLPTQTFQTTTSGAAAITGTFTKAAATPSRVVVAIQGVNRLFMKQVLQPNDVGTFPMVVTTPSLPAGEQLFFTVYSDTDVTGAVAWAPVVEGAPRAVNLRRRADGTTLDPTGSGIAEMMGGGFHGWSYGDWNGSKPLTESQLTFDPAAPTHDFFPMLSVPAPLPPPPPPAGTVEFPDLNPIHLVKDAAHLGGRVVGGIEDLATGAVDIFRSGVGKGIHLFGAFTNFASSLFCKTEHPVRVTTSGNKGLEFGVGPLNAGFNTGSSETTVEMMDMNGDRYPDSVTKDGIRLNTGTQFATTVATPLPYDQPRHIEHRNVHLGASAGNLVTITDGAGNASGFLGGGVGLSYGVSATDRDLIDMNGDGLPDHVRTDASGSVFVRLNFGARFGGEMKWAGAPWLVHTVSSQQDLVNRFGDDLRTDSVRVEDTSSNNGGLSVGGAGNSFGFGVSATTSDTMMRTLVDMVDVNGDGLPDQVMRSPGLGCNGTTQPSSFGCLRVKLNLGRSFDVEKQIPIAPWPANSSPGTPGGLANFGLGSPDALSFTIGAGSAGGVSATVQVYIFEFGGGDSWSSSDNHISLSFEDIDGDGTLDHVLKANGNPTVFTRLNQSGKTNLLKQVIRPLGGSFDLDYGREGNKVDGTLLLDNPKNQWALSQVIVHDGQGNDYATTFDYSLAGPDAPLDQRISSGHFARDERDDYGYGHVTTTRGIKQANGTFLSGDGSRVEQFFFNHDFYEKGLLRAAFEKNPGGGLMRGTLVTYVEPGASVPVRTGRFFPAEAQRVSAFYEGVATTVGAALGDGVGLAPKYKLEKRTLYDADGNLKTFEDWGDEQSTADDVSYAITYLQEATTHITRATQIDASPRTAPGTVLRSRIATFDTGLGSIKTLTNVVTGGKVPATGAAYNGASSTYTYTHDAFGNLATYKDPTGYNLKYTYDTTAQANLTRVDDVSFGYFSTVVPDLRFAAPTSTTDINGQIQSFTYDEFGRVLTVNGPTDQGSTATIQMTYAQQSPASLPPIWASTKHKDVQAAADPIETVSFVDGVRRVIQTKKDVVVDPAGNGTVQTGMSVSGQVVFDSRGRVAQQGQPGFDTGPAHSFVGVPRAVPAFTLFAYDSLDRVRSHTLPDGALTTTRYFVGPLGSDALGDGKKWLMTETIDAIGNTTTTPAHDLNLGRRLTYADSRGNHIAVREHNNVGTDTTLTALTTRYTYDPLDQLLTVADANGNVTTAVYDTVGQMVSLTSPDAGRTEFRFDLAGNLGAKETPVLRAQGKTIQYVYSFNRLAKIDEPTMPDVTFTYGGPTEKGNALGNLAGRIKQVVSEGSTEQRFYDAMGNVNKTVTTLPNMAQTTPATVTFTMKYAYDWLGRMQNMTFPNWIDNTLNILAGEGELVTYTYDRGGNLNKIGGFIQTPNPQQTSSPRTFTYLQHIGYNEFEQQTLFTSGNGVANKFGYDAPTRRLTDVSADSLGALERQQGRAATPFHRMHYDYDKVGNVTHLQNGVSLQPWRNAGVFVGPLDVTYTYDALYQLKTLTGKYRPNVAFAYQYSDSFVYDSVGNITKKAQSQDRLTYANQNVTPTTDPVQAMAQLNGSTFDHNVNALTYTLDYVYANGRPHATSTVNETLPNQAPTPRVLSYDGGGNNTGNTFRGTTRAQIWDEEDRLKQVTVSGGNAGKFRYNEAGERTKKQTAAGDAWYVNQYFVLLPNNLPTKHIFAGATRVASKTDSIFMQNPVVNFYHPDHIGSTSYTTAANQDLVQHERYFAFGELWRPGAEQEECDLGRPDNLRREWAFTSKEWDPDSSLYYFGARYFDPHTAAWQSPDPILASYMRGRRNGGVFNPRNLGLYTYAGNNPVVFFDPNGETQVAFQLRSFAPFRSFGFGFSGDNRGFSTSTDPSTTARVRTRFEFDTNTGQIGGLSSASDPSHFLGHFATTGIPSATASVDSSNPSSHTFEISASHAGSNPIVPGAADIDLGANIQLRENNGILSVTSLLHGDNFPNSELIVQDTAGNAVFLGGFATSGGQHTGPFIHLPGEGKEILSGQNRLDILLNKNGQFAGVLQGGKTVPIKDYNAQFKPNRN